MKAEIHPNYVESTITCSTCGTVVHTHATTPTIRIDLCSNCHPFYTGKQRIVDTAGRVDRFNQRRDAGEKAQKVAKAAERKRSKTDTRPTVPDLSEAEKADAPVEIMPADPATSDASKIRQAVYCSSNLLFVQPRAEPDERKLPNVTR